jgi:hypothetical protein
MAAPAFTYLKNPDGTDKTFQIPAFAAAFWTLATDYIPGPTKLKIEVVDPASVWQYAPGQQCRASGTTRNDPGALLPAAPIGALIGKLGGGTADCPPPPTSSGPSAMPAGMKLFGVGTIAVIDVKADDSGPLFLTMNDTLAGFLTHAGLLLVKIATGS